MSHEQPRILVFGAHPDDADFKAAGLACLWAQRGYAVRFVSLTDGSAGHHQIAGAQLAARRVAEAAASARVAGIEYLVLDNPDGELAHSIENRRRVVRMIREFAPDLVLAPRPDDYHPDHRNTALLVRDAAYMVTVPPHVASVPHLRYNPIFAYVYDHFDKPTPYKPDIVIDIDAVIEKKLRMIHSHTSQVYEWLPYNAGIEADEVPAGEQERLDWLRQRYLARDRARADQFRAQLIDRYGMPRGVAVRHAETIQVSEYGRPMTAEDAARLFPF